MSRIILLMGVSGAGKTTIGRKLAERLGWDFYDADSFHNARNIAKMGRGEPLTDEDRGPWLDAIRHRIENQLKQQKPAVFTCSALKRRYRQHLTEGLANVDVVHLTGSFHLIKGRIDQRQSHFMKAALLKSQFDALEPPEDAHEVNVEGTVDEAVEAIVRLIGAREEADR